MNPWSGEPRLDVAAMFADALEGLPSPVWIRSADGLDEFRNPEFERVLAGGGPRGELDHGDAAVLERGEVVRMHLALPVDGDIRNYNVEKFPLRGPDGAPIAICGYAADVTGEKAAGAALRRLAQQMESDVRARTVGLEAANRELEGVAAGLSHELRRSLRAVELSIGVLTEEHGMALEETGSARLDAIRAASSEMLAMVDGLLVLFRAGHVELQEEHIDLGELATEVADDLVRQAPDRGIRVLIGELPECRGDRRLLRLALVNLIANAIKYTHDREPAVIEVGTVLDGRGPSVYVRDNGRGIDPREVEEIFAPFKRADHSGTDGAGVGLAIVRRVLHRHGGHAWAEARSGQGASFYFTLGEGRINA